MKESKNKNKGLIGALLKSGALQVGKAENAPNVESGNGPNVESVSRADCVRVFEDTERMCREDAALAAAVADSISRQKVWLEEETVPEADVVRSERTQILASGKRTFEAAEAYAKAGKRVCVLNFASAMSPGGGVKSGARAQEEGLCRCSTLYPALAAVESEFYRRHWQMYNEGRMDRRYNDDCIFTPDVVVFKTDTLVPEVRPETERFKVDVITCAAPNRVFELPGEALAELFRRRIRRILQVAALNQAEVLILGAFGCGAFFNPPDVVAAAFREVLNEFAGRFEMVEFAVYCRAKGTMNYRVFKSVFDGQSPESASSGTAAAVSRSGTKRSPEVAVPRDRAKGMLWGLIVGDAFGSPIQFSPKDDHPSITEMVECPVFHLPPGYWTDDGSMTLCVMDSYCRKGGYDLQDIAETFYRWLSEGYLSSIEVCSFDVGRATRFSLSDFHKTGSLVNGVESSQGNGSIMRFAPSYLIARREGRPEIRHEVSDVTHASGRVREVIDRFTAILDAHVSGERTTLKSPYSSREEVNNSGWAVTSLEAALWAFETTDSFADGLIAAVNLGGDSDSIGAVYGQLAGAYYGFSAIPERWVKAVKTWEAIDARIESFLDLVLSSKTIEKMN